MKRLTDRATRSPRPVSPQTYMHAHQKTSNVFVCPSGEPSHNSLQHYCESVQHAYMRAPRAKVPRSTSISSGRRVACIHVCGQPATRAGRSGPGEQGVGATCDRSARRTIAARPGDVLRHVSCGVGAASGVEADVGAVLDLEQLGVAGWVDGGDEQPR